MAECHCCPLACLTACVPQNKGLTCPPVLMSAPLVFSQLGTHHRSRPFLISSPLTGLEGHKRQLKPETEKPQHLRYEDETGPTEGNEEQGSRSGWLEMTEVFFCWLVPPPSALLLFPGITATCAELHCQANRKRTGHLSLSAYLRPSIKL